MQFRTHTNLYNFGSAYFDNFLKSVLRVVDGAQIPHFRLAVSNILTDSER